MRNLDIPPNLMCGNLQYRDTSDVGVHSSVLPNNHPCWYALRRAPKHDHPCWYALRRAPKQPPLLVCTQACSLTGVRPPHVGVHSGVLPNMVTLLVQSRLHYVGIHSRAANGLQRLQLGVLVLRWFTGGSWAATPSDFHPHMMDPALYQRDGQHWLVGGNVRWF